MLSELRCYHLMSLDLSDGVVEQCWAALVGRRSRDCASGSRGRERERERDRVAVVYPLELDGPCRASTSDEQRLDPDRESTQEKKGSSKDQCLQSDITIGPRRARQGRVQNLSHAQAAVRLDTGTGADAWSVTLTGPVVMSWARREGFRDEPRSCDSTTGSKLPTTGWHTHGAVTQLRDHITDMVRPHLESQSCSSGAGQTREDTPLRLRGRPSKIGMTEQWSPLSIQLAVIR